MEPSDDTLVLLGRVLQFPIGFFSAGEIDEPSQDHASFRALSSMTAVQRHSALAAGALAIEFAHWLDRRFELPLPEVPDLRGAEPEAAAEAMRQKWAIGERPIGNLVHLLELSGVRVFSLAEQCREVDAFSLWRNGTPYVFLNTQKTPEHSRFDAAHELGHLVLHRHGHGGCDGAPSVDLEMDVSHGRKAEDEANAFAAALLMPRTTLLATTPRIPTLGKLIEIKKTWRVSLAALVHRLHRLKVLNEWQYRNLCIEISRNGYRDREVYGLTERETSQILAKAFAELREHGTTRADVARALHMPAAELEGLLFGLTIAAVDGEGQTTSPPRGQLRLV
jgi:Zn-dependent peptidase ImmA (M78 family)